MYRTKIFHSTSRDVLIIGNNQHWKSLRDIFDRFLLFSSLLWMFFSRNVSSFPLAERLEDPRQCYNLSLTLLLKTILRMANQNVKRSKTQT